MSAHTVITCDTVTDGRRCRGTTTVYNTCIVSFARELATQDGWGTRAAGGQTLDLCPDCAPCKSLPARLVPGRSCPPGSPCHLLGHDAIGHRVTNILARMGLSLEEATALANADSFRIPGLGPEGKARLKSRLSERKPVHR
ncbi:hypothetical protein [Streptomyces violaceusniger]|uniref:Uncharacterized protein n=1 Tax=Streptomyces violaceusniger (strain Tu 4113) TaxID=653045 RepID=G2PHZ5_STRV4|nr:hypothetical protein [Streptomyces violaceusniger]AEM88946.1 hypothetical protein Strvi_0173 [Streptomyces violaceusniger Tu 4113]